jgi:hypothetical protein
MAEQQGDRIRVILKWIQILDKLEPAYKEKGEFRFTARVSNDLGESRETKMPESGHYSISDHPAWNKLTMDKLIFEGAPGNKLTVQLDGEEIDLFSANDHLDHYQREFTGPLDEWLGWYGPGDERSTDPENLSNWRVCYEIVRA